MPKADTLGDIGADMDQLGSNEQEELQLAINRGLADTRSDAKEVVRQKVQEYMAEIEVAAQIAKRELQGTFDGQRPNSGNFGLGFNQPGYWGYDDWDDMPSLTGYTANDWIDGSTPSNNSSGGSGGLDDPLTVGEGTTHIILGYGSYASDPVVSRVEEQKNDNPIPCVETEDAFRNSDLRIKWLDTPRILQPDDTFAARVYPGGESGNSYEEALYPVHITFLEARYKRILDPANMTGSGNNNIVTW